MREGFWCPACPHPPQQVRGQQDGLQVLIPYRFRTVKYRDQQDSIGMFDGEQDAHADVVLFRGP